MKKIKKMIGVLSAVSILCAALPASATQNVVDTTIDLGGINRYVVNEDFNDYTGGTPANSVTMVNGWGVTTSAVASTHTNAQDKAIKMSLDDSAAVFKFNKPIQGGKFIIEFDVKHNGGGWGINLLKERDFLPANYLGKTHWEIGKDGSGNPVIGNSAWLTAQNDYYQTKLAEAKAADPSLDETTWRNANWVSLWSSYRTNSANVLAMRDADIKASNVVNAADNSIVLWYSNSRKQSANPGNVWLGRVYYNQWDHVKVEVDTAAGTYTFTVQNDPTVTYPVTGTLDSSNFASGKYNGDTNDENSFAGSYNINNGQQRWTFGFGGIALRTHNYGGDLSDKYVEFDNVKVYTENAYNDYETFDHNRTQTQSLQSWYNVLQNGPASKPEKGDALNPWRSYYYTSQGKNYNADTNPTDKALAYVISPRGAGVIGHQFSVPVKAGKSFEIDFDIKIDNRTFDGSNTGDGKDTAFSFHLMTQNRMLNYRYNGDVNLNNDSGGFVYLENGSTNNYFYEKNLLFANSAIADGGSLEDTGKFRFYTGREGWDPTSSNGTVAYKDGDNSTNLYLNSKAWNHIKLSGRASGGYYLVTLTVNDVTSQEYTTAILSNEDILAVAFKPLKTTDYQRRAIHLDNFMVRETGYAKNGVASVNKVTGASATVDFSDEFKDTDTSIEVEFETANLTSGDLDYIGVRNVTKNVEANITKTLLPDNKTVSITFNTNPDICDELELYVNKKTQMTGSDTYLNVELTKFEDYTQTFDYLTDAFYVGGIDLYRSNNGAAWQLITAPITNINAATDRFKLIAHGYNGTNTTKNINLFNVEYCSGETELMNMISYDSEDIPHGSFEIESTPSLLSGAGNKIKSFFWEYIDNGYKALIRNLDYNITYSAE